MAKGKPKKIPQKVTRYYPCFHDPGNPKNTYEFDGGHFSTYAGAAKQVEWLNRWKHKIHSSYIGEDVEYFVAKVTIEPATAPLPQRKPKRKAA